MDTTNAFDGTIHVHAEEVLKCDQYGCGHIENVGQITQDMVDTPCPRCGESLLTPHAWKRWKRDMDNLLKSLNKSLPEFDSKVMAQEKSDHDI